ncbi:PREDICTED: protein shisa-5-like isoform X2 [Wasmannia auropunctata]|uniref:protein shisa-5-like isoform X2 n=1 Tax=Wasmannia auropunctata TaxID=64793 RepID=UPI0005F09A03|nr:PREDICTED: protein shisa-5-like isoform X2 [Wasmannia auropunctata]
MSRLAVALLLICLHVGSGVYGIDCTYGRNKNVFDDFLTTCPRLTDSPEKTFCCIDLTNDNAYCCTAEEFAIKTGFGVVIPVIIGSVIVIAVIVCCISCLCCSCCPWYRRRQGTVYGIQAPVVQVIQPQANLPPSYTNQPPSYSVPYPTGSTGMPQPPPYNEAYAKQAPYNPAYPPSQ